VGYGGAWLADQPGTIATIAIGYADGVPRSAPAEATVRVREIEIEGKLSPIVGRVTMDMCMALVDHHVAVGDTATVFGGLVSLDRQAAAAGTISYELLTRVGARIPRRYRRPS
jgi:alanine racemase